MYLSKILLYFLKFFYNYFDITFIKGLFANTAVNNF